MQTIAHSPADLCKSVHAPLVAERFATKKSRNPKAPAVQLVVCPDKIDSCGDGLMWDGRPREPALSEVEGSKPSKARQLPAITATSESMLYCLRAPSRPHRQVPHLRQNARHLHPVHP